MTKLILTLTLAAGAVTVAPRPVAAAGCTDEYVTCLNDSYDLTGVLQTMADIECFAGYGACIARKLKFI